MLHRVADGHQHETQQQATMPGRRDRPAALSQNGALPPTSWGPCCSDSQGRLGRWIQLLTHRKTCDPCSGKGQQVHRTPNC